MRLAGGVLALVVLAGCSSDETLLSEELAPLAKESKECRRFVDRLAAMEDLYGPMHLGKNGDIERPAGMSDSAYIDLVGDFAICNVGSVLDDMFGG